MDKDREYTLRIDAYTPETMPMARLAEYMGDLARLLGEEKSVHFVRLEEGSAVLVHRIEQEADPKVRERVVRARNGAGPSEAIKAIRSINRRLKEDNGTGVLGVRGGAEIIKFPGREEVQAIQGSVTQEDTLDGIVVRLGGLQDWVPVHLQARDGGLSACLARKPMAQHLGKYIYDAELRVHGRATWFRIAESWHLERFYIHRFDLLDDRPLSSVIADLQAVEGSEWPSVADPWAELRRIRAGEH
jgi:hypothetical protein